MSIPRDGLALVLGAQGGIGKALVEQLQSQVPARFARVMAASRHSVPALDLLSEASIEAIAAQVDQTGLALRLVIDATGFLHGQLNGQAVQPEKSLRQLDPQHLAHAFALNAIGPALLMKHLLPRLPSQGKAVFATLSAKVGSIGDNQLGGWYSYRASKAALNQLVHTAAIELRRRAPQAVCVALHPGTVDTALSAPFGKQGLHVRTPEACAALLLDLVDQLDAAASGGFFAPDGTVLPW
jgi:NAD(P)-dependent dehydrogenase (short-subunit alcohol dehydrogenase family)